MNCGVDSGLKTTVYVFDARIKPFADEGDRTDSDNLVGHSWGQYWLNDLSVELFDATIVAEIICEDVGFYPLDNPYSGPGDVRLGRYAGSDSHPVTGAGNYRVRSFKELRQAIYLVKAKLPPNSPQYHLLNYNCTDFAIDLGLWVDVTTMSPVGRSTPWAFSDWLIACPGL